MKRSSLLLFLAGGVAFLILTNSFAFSAQRNQEEVRDEDLQKIIELHYDQGRKYYQEKDYHKAKEEFAEILKFDPRHRAAIKYTELCNKNIKKAEKIQKQKKRFSNLVVKAMKAKKERGRKAKKEERAKLKAERRTERLKGEENLRKTKEAKLKKREESRLEAQKKRRGRLEKKAEEKIKKQQERKRRVEELKAKREALKVRRAEKRKAKKEERAKLRSERRKDRLKVPEEPDKKRRAQPEALIREEEGIGEELLPPTLGERISEEKRKQKEKEDELLLFAEQRLRALQENVNAFLEEDIAEKEAKNHFQRGEEYFKQGRYARAREEFKKTLAIYPADKKAAKYAHKASKLEFKNHFQTGKRYFKQRRHKEAREEFEKALSIYPADKKAARYIRKINKSELELE